MLKLIHVQKDYTAGNATVRALDGIDIAFRKSEFVSVLGQSGSGKTTLLNLIGGLDQYTSGDLIIGGRSTKEFKDADWDAYRNHSVGFVFQTYNLIPHQSVLKNVELALTISGVSKLERRKRAQEALTRVGLADQMRKKPNQLSGGQMQRVAIARALASDPDILLADEPTGALDSETSVQVMEILKEIARDRLVIMGTHNPELAQRYSTRIVRLLDGKIVDDTAPYDGADDTEAPAKQASGRKHPSMSFGTALSLSLNNLMTKKARTILTCFAGSIGIIGIALVLSVSTGFQEYINRVLEDTLSSYPVTIQAESVDMSSMMETLAEARGQARTEKERDKVYESAIMYDMMNSFTGAEITRNNLTAFKTFLETDEEIRAHLSAVSYAYDAPMNVYVRDRDGAIVKSDIMTLMSKMGTAQYMPTGEQFSSYTSFDMWEEMLPGNDGALVSGTLLEQYDVLAGRWPQSADEVVLFVNRNNELSDMALYMLGLKTTNDMMDFLSTAQAGKEIDTSAVGVWEYADLLGLTFRLIPGFEQYQKNADGTYSDLAATDAGMTLLFGNEEIGVTLKVSGIMRPNPDAVASMMSGSVGYTSALTARLMQKTAEAEIVRAQLADPNTDVLTGLPFAGGAKPATTDVEKAAAFRAYAKALPVAEKAALYREIAAEPTEEYIDATIDELFSGNTREELEKLVLDMYAKQMGLPDTTLIQKYIRNMTDEAFQTAVAAGMREQIAARYTEEAQARLAATSDDEAAALLDSLDAKDGRLAALHDQYVPSRVSEATFEGNLKLLGYASEDSPSSINLYATTFEHKDEIARIIEEYNDAAADEDRITYTDYVALLMSSVTTIINAISYVLMAFVAISLIVSSIMIGVITYISVLERTKEIGVLRAVGASKRDISRVFNAETAIVGLTAGVLGIAISLLMLIPINFILFKLTEIALLKAILPMGGAAILVAVSVTLTFIAGLIPSRLAARKNPVEALRSE